MVIIATSFHMRWVLAEVEQVNPHDVLLRTISHAVKLLLVNRSEEDSLDGGQTARIRRFLFHFYTPFLSFYKRAADIVAQQIKPLFPSEIGIMRAQKCAIDFVHEFQQKKA